MSSPQTRAFYATPGPMTDLGSVPARVLQGLPDDPVELGGVASGVIVHEQLTSLYGWDLPFERRPELQTRSAADMVGLILDLDDRPLVEPRPAERRMVGNCRHFTTLTSALLRAKGFPVRARCGFAAYFTNDRFVDHWIVERWEDVTERWVQHDSQIDEVQYASMGLEFEPADLPSGFFLSGGQAWQRCRRGEADPDHFGILNLWGLWFVRGNVVRDLAALNKVELLPWDAWGLLDGRFDENDSESLAFLDSVAAVAAAGELVSARSLYESDDRLRVPEVVTSWAEAGGARVHLPELEMR